MRAKFFPFPVCWGDKRRGICYTRGKQERPLAASARGSGGNGICRAKDRARPLRRCLRAGGEFTPRPFRRRSRHLLCFALPAALVSAVAYFAAVLLFQPALLAVRELVQALLSAGLNTQAMEEALATFRYFKLVYSAPVLTADTRSCPKTEGRLCLWPGAPRNRRWRHQQL